MSTSESGYNGWSNYETWCVHLWLSNEQGTQRECERMAQRASDANTAANVLKEFVSDMCPELETSMFSDLLTTALGEVDWYEIAEAFREGMDEDGDDQERD